MLHPRRPRLLNLPLQHLVADPPLRRISIHTPRMNRVQANIQDVPATAANAVQADEDAVGVYFSAPTLPRVSGLGRLQCSPPLRQDTDSAAYQHSNFHGSIF
jgi:hypothetical protein